MLRIHEKLEKNSILLTIGILVTIAIGGIVEVVPLFTIDETIEKVDGVRPYSPLELAGRNIYIREGCYVCPLSALCFTTMASVAKMTSSAILVARSATLSRLRLTRINSNACSIAPASLRMSSTSFAHVCLFSLSMRSSL